MEKMKFFKISVQNFPDYILLKRERKSEMSAMSWGHRVTSLYEKSCNYSLVRKYVKYWKPLQLNIMRKIVRVCAMRTGDNKMAQFIMWCVGVEWGE